MDALIINIFPQNITAENANIVSVTRIINIRVEVDTIAKLAEKELEAQGLPVLALKITNVGRGQAMRSKLLTDTDKRFRTRTFDIIAVMLIFTAIIVSLILIFSTLNTLLMMSTDTLNKLNDVSMELDNVRQSIDPAEENRSTGQIEALGTFVVTHYCPCEKCCGKSDGITATGTTATEGRTIAVDPSIIPLGTEVEIDGHTYIAEDVGGAIKGYKVDIFVNDHSEAIQRGKFEREVRY